MPYAGLKLHELSNPDPANGIETEFLVNDRRLLVALFSTKDLTQVHPITDGIGLTRTVV